VSFSRHGILLLNFEGMANFEGTDNSPWSEINARKFRTSVTVKTPTQELHQKIHGLLTLAPSSVQSVKTRGLHHVTKVTLVFSTSFFTDLLKSGSN
jgi:hypothetical protein